MIQHETLPIEEHKDRIMACDAEYFIVEAETGSGKTTQVPQWFYEQGLRVLVTEPRTEAVIGNAILLFLRLEFFSKSFFSRNIRRNDLTRFLGNFEIASGQRTRAEDNSVPGFFCKQLRL